MKLNKVLYEYALNSNEKLVNINNVQNGERYYCPTCKNEMYFRINGQRQNHFAHKPNTNNNFISEISECTKSNESYLHDSFKYGLFNLLQEKIYSNDKCFYVEWDCSNFGVKNKNILEFASKIEIEKNLDPFKPDITIYDMEGNPSIAIEIVVSHKPDTKKLKFFSENKIYLLEIDLDKENFSVLNNIEQVARKPIVFTYTPEITNEISICNKCSCKSFSSFLNICNVECPFCKERTRFSYVSYKNQKRKDCKYYFDNHISILERNILNNHGIFFNDDSFNCDNCGIKIKNRFLKAIPQKIVPFENYCPNCHNKKNEIIYKQIKFQNKSELKWAKFFDEKNILWEYNLSSYRFPDINPFPVFYLKESNQFFRANNYENWNNIDRLEKDKAKADILSNKTGRDVIFGDITGLFFVLQDGMFYDDDASFLAKCNKCDNWYFSNNEGSYECKVCEFYDGDNTFEIGSYISGENNLFFE